MKKIGIQAEPWGYDFFAFLDQFLLTASEAEELTSRLRRAGMDTFKGEDVPESILPQNIPGFPFQGVVFGKAGELRHPQVLNWEVHYKEMQTISSQAGTRELSLYPRLELQVSSSDEGHVLTARPYLGFFLNFKGQDRRTDHFDKNEFMDLVTEYARNQLLRSDKTAGFITRGYGAMNEGWNFAPVSNLPLIIQGAIHCATHVAPEELSQLGALRHVVYGNDFGRNVYHPDEKYAVEVARRGAEKEYHDIRRNLVSRMQETTPKAKVA